MKKGMSFTLTVVVVGVILMTTALTIITLGSASLGDFFNTITGQGDQQVEQAAVQQACGRVAQRIQTRYCDAYYSSSDDTTTQRRTEPDHTETCNQQGCDVTGDPFTWTDEDRGSDYTSIDITVTVEGNEYNCYDFGIPPSCPVME